jgi:release factor glutamine methyltransferase
LQAAVTPRLDAELLLAHVLGLSRTDLYAHPERSLLAHQLAAYRALLDRRAQGEPLPYLTGHIEFYGLDMTVNAHVLIPRPETETLVDLALGKVEGLRSVLSKVEGRLSLADVGTGSGCIAIALAVHAPQARIMALDLSPDALDVARANAGRHGVADRITFLQSDLLAALPKAVDLIVANPPYIAADEWPGLPREVREHEPQLALDGGPDGLDVIRRLLEQAPARLRPGGALLVEIGAGQGAAATRLARQLYPSADVAIQPDLAGRDRVLCVETQQGGSDEGS